MTAVVLVLGLVSALSFAAGYGARSLVSYRRRVRAKRGQQWRLPATS